MPKRQENPVCNRNIMELSRPLRLPELESAAAAIYREAQRCGFATREVDAAIEYGRKLAGGR